MSDDNKLLLDAITAWESAEYDGLRGILPNKADIKTREKYNKLSRDLFYIERKLNIPHETILTRFNNYNNDNIYKILFALQINEGINLINNILNELSIIYISLSPKKRGRKRKPSEFVGKPKKAKGRPKLWDDDMCNMLTTIIDRIKSEYSYQTDKEAIEHWFKDLNESRGKRPSNKIIDYEETTLSPSKLQVVVCNARKNLKNKINST